nr:hypothetical protein [Natrinema limicola]
MRLVFVSRIFEVLDGDLKVELVGDIGDRFRDFNDAYRARNLIVNDVIIRPGVRVVER